jgi:hypothetical protein
VVTLSIPAGLTIDVSDTLALNGARGNLAGKADASTVTAAIGSSPGGFSFNGSTGVVATVTRGLVVSISGVTNPVCNAPLNPTVTVQEGFGAAFVQHVAVNSALPQLPRPVYGATANTQVHILVTGLQSNVSLNWPDVVSATAGSGRLVLISETSTDAYYQFSTTNQATSDATVESFNVVPVVSMTVAASVGTAKVQTQLVPTAATASVPRFDDPLQPSLGADFITVVDCNPAPNLTGLSPSSAVAGGSPFTLTVIGTDFVNGAVVRWNLLPRATTFVSSTELRADILATDIATAIPVNVTVQNPTPGGGISVSQIFTIIPVSPVPTLVGLNPTSVVVGASDFILTVTGTNFVTGAVVRWNGTSRPTTLVSNTTLRADIAAADVTAVGSASITVFNPAPGGGASNQLDFFIIPASPIPTLNSMSPVTATAGSAGFQLSVFGIDFTTGSKVRWNGLDRLTTFVNSTELRATILASDIGAVGSASVTVYTGPPGGGTSSALSFIIANPLPTITSLNPASTLAGNAAIVLTVNGAYFVVGSIVTWDGTPLTTTFVSATQLKATVPSINLASAGISRVAVVNVPTGGGTSNAEPFVINNLVPATTSISPNAGIVGGTGFVLTVNGSKFFSGSVVRWNGEDRPTTLVSSTRLTADIPAADLATAGTSSVTVYNPEPGGGTSNAQVFTRNNPLPVLVSLSPAGAFAGDTALTLTVTGANFVASSKVRWKGADRATTFVSSTQLKASIPATDLTIAATVAVTVFSPGPGGGTSNPLNFAIDNPVPVLSNLTPNAAPALTSSLSVSVTGSLFVPTSKVRWNGIEVSTKFVSTTEIKATLTATQLAQPGTATVTVSNPPPGGGLSADLTFTIGNPASTTKSISPTSALVGSSSFTLTVTGANFITASKVHWNGAERTTQYLSSTQLAAAIPNSDLEKAGLASVTVVNPNNGGLGSNAQTFTINNPLPSIASLNPASGRVGDEAFDLTVTGSNFIENSKVRWKGADRPTTFVSATQLVASISASDLAAVGKVGVTVFNPAPGGGNSSSVNFSIGNALPKITSLSPSSVIAGGPTFALTVSGTNFVSASKLQWNGVTRTTTFVNATQIRATIAAADIAASGTATLTVINSTTDGPSLPVPFPVNALALSLLTLSSTSLAGGTPVTATVALNGPALPGGVVVNLASSDPSAATPPASIVVPGGASSVSFAVDTQSQNAVRTVTLSASYGGVIRKANLVIAGGAQSDDSSNTLFVPIILSSSGANGSFYTSSLTLTNRGTRDAILDFSYAAALSSGSGAASDVLPAGTQRVFSNAVEYLRSLGVAIPDSGNRGGTLQIRAWGLATPQDVAATVRTTTAVTDGRAGLAYTGISSSAALTKPAYLFGLRQNASDRSNLALQNAGKPGDGDITLSVTVFSGNPAEPGAYRLPDEVLAPGGFRQINSILESNGLSLSNGFARVERLSGTAPYYCYAVINDQANSDGSFLVPVVEESLLAQTGVTLPVIVEAGAFSSELILVNASAVSKTVRCQLVAKGIENAGDTANFTIQLAPGQQAIYPDLIQRLRESSVAGIAPPGPSLAGALFVTVDGSSADGIFVGARTSAAGGGGRYGLFYSGVPFGAAATSGTWLYGLQQDAENRTNLALVNTGEVDASENVFRIELFDGASGTQAAIIDGIALGPRQWTQLPMILKQYAPGSQNGYARVVRVAGNNPFIAYAVLNDGSDPGARTGDGAYVAMEGEP